MHSLSFRSLLRVLKSMSDNENDAEFGSLRLDHILITDLLYIFIHQQNIERRNRRRRDRARLIRSLRNQARLYLSMQNQDSVEPTERPASKEAVNSLPIVKIEDTSYDRNDKTQILELQICIICMQDISIGSDAIRMPCEHLFHPN